MSYGNYYGLLTIILFGGVREFISDLIHRKRDLYLVHLICISAKLDSVSV